MSSKPVRIPGPDHPIAIERHGARVTVTVAGKIIADSRDVLSLREASYPAALYFPRKDVDMTQLQRTTNATHCPYKGDCSYYSIAAGGSRSNNAVWSYESPYPAMAAIKDHLSFYPNRVDEIAES